MSDSKNKSDQVELNIVKVEKTKHSLIPKKFPSRIKVVLEELLTILDLNSDIEKGIWDYYEIIAINKVTQSELLVNLYKHLDKFELHASDIESLILQVFAKSYSVVKRNKSLSVEFEFERYRDCYSQIASTAFKLYELLDGADIPHESDLSKFINKSNIQRDLIAVLSKSTAYRWPSLHLRYRSGFDARGYCEQIEKQEFDKLADFYNFDNKLPIPDWEVVDACQFEEMPELSKRKWSATDEKFPPIELSEPYKVTSRGVYLQFVEITLELLKKFSDDIGRTNTPQRRGNYLYPNESCYLFFSAGHWRSLLEVLFNVDADNKSINEVIKRFKENNYNNN